MREPHVWTFFYGSYINLDVLQEVQLVPAQHEVATLTGFDIRIAPRANLIREPGRTVFGILAAVTHAELARLYAHAQDVLGERYLPEAVVAQTLRGELRPALCYICPEMTPRPAEAAYVERIVGPARRYGFPDWYVARLMSFHPEAPAR